VALVSVGVTGKAVAVEAAVSVGEGGTAWTVATSAGVAVCEAGLEGETRSVAVAVGAGVRRVAKACVHSGGKVGKTSDGASEAVGWAVAAGGAVGWRNGAGANWGKAKINA
jgi:hypothetical protein